jgi:hypothetical protein
LDDPPSIGLNLHEFLGDIGDYPTWWERDQKKQIRIKKKRIRIKKSNRGQKKQTPENMRKHKETITK